MSNEIKDKIKKENSFATKHAELWKFIKFTIAGVGASLVELLAHMLLLNVVFVALKSVPVTSSALNFLGIDYQGYMYAFFISTAIGYAIAFVLNRKVTFHADSNQALSIFLYVLMVIFTIFANTWFGSLMSNVLIERGWDNTFGNLIVKVIGMSIPTLWTYPLNRFVIHRKKKTA